MAAESKKRKIENQEQKLNHVDPIFMSFLNDTQKKYELDSLERAFAYVKSGTNDMNLAILEIIDANPRTSVSFTYATLNTKIYELNPKLKTPPGFLLGDIFVDGFDVLTNFLETCTVRPRIPKDDMKQQALAKLLKFLLNPNQDALFEEQPTEEKRAVTLAQHLLSKLSVHKSYVVDSSLNSSLQDFKVCPCQEKDMLVGKKGDTSYGYEKGWHGKTDIVIEDLPVSIVRENREEVASDDLSLSGTGEENEDDASEDRSVSSIEVKNKESFSKRDLRQLMSQTIVFSFLQHKLNKLGNYLIPGIGIGTKDLLIYFYDCENDVFLSSKPLQLFCGKEIALPGVLFLWLSLNYRLFCSGIPDGMKPYRAKFFNRAEDFLEGYYKEVTKPLHMPLHMPHENLKQTYFGWSINPGIHFKVREPNVDYIDLSLDPEDILR